MKFNVVNNKESGCVLSVSGQCVVAQARSALLASSPCALYSVSWRPLSVSFGLWIILFILLPPSLPSFIFPLINQCVRCLVPLAWGLLVGRRGFTRGWLCQKCKHLDIPGTHLY